MTAANETAVNCEHWTLNTTDKQILWTFCRIFREKKKKKFGKNIWKDEMRGIANEWMKSIHWMGWKLSRMTEVCALCMHTWTKSDRLTKTDSKSLNCVNERSKNHFTHLIIQIKYNIIQKRTIWYSIDEMRAMRAMRTVNCGHFRMGGWMPNVCAARLSIYHCIWSHAHIFSTLNVNKMLETAIAGCRAFIYFILCIILQKQQWFHRNVSYGKVYSLHLWFHCYRIALNKIHANLE